MPAPAPTTPFSFRQQAKRLVQRIQGKRFLHFLHIGKTGGSAVKHALQPHAEGRRYVIYLHPHHVRLMDLPHGEGVIFFLRDPLSRFVSGFYSRQRQGQPRYTSPWTAEERQAFELFETPNDLGAALSAADADRKARAMQAMRAIEHVRSSYWDWFQHHAYFAARSEDIFFVGFQSTLKADFEALAAKLGLPASARLPEDDVQAHRNPANVDKKLGDEASANLKSWYQRDYEFLALCERLAADRRGDRTRRVA